jgi:hypothetical protein
MSEDVIQVLDNAGNVKKIRAFSNSVAGNTVVNEIATLGDSAGNTALIDATLQALRVTLRPFELLGVYSFSQATGGYSGLAANSEIFQFRWTDATKLAVLLRASISVGATVGASAAGLIDRQLIKATGFSASGSGGTQVLAANVNKKRTSFPTSVVGDLRIASNSALGAGTKTLAGTGIGIAATGMGTLAIASQGGNQVLPKVDLYNVSAGGVMEYPEIAVTNEGWVIRMTQAEPTSATLFSAIDFIWAEVAAF